MDLLGVSDFCWSVFPLFYRWRWKIVVKISNRYTFQLILQNDTLHRYQQTTWMLCCQTCHWMCHASFLLSGSHALKFHGDKFALVISIFILNFNESHVLFCLVNWYLRSYFSSDSFYLLPAIYSLIFFSVVLIPWCQCARY